MRVVVTHGSVPSVDTTRLSIVFVLLGGQNWCWNRTYGGFPESFRLPFPIAFRELTFVLIRRPPPTGTSRQGRFSCAVACKRPVVAPADNDSAGSQARTPADVDHPIWRGFDKDG